MISGDDIEAMADDFDTADKIVDRVRNGVPAGREMMADEVMPFIRAYVVMQDTAARAAKFMADLHQRELQGMELGEPRKPKPPSQMDQEG